MVQQGVRVHGDRHYHRERLQEEWPEGGTRTLAGGAIHNNQTWLLQGIVVLAKDLEWAACTLVALWLLSGCSDCGRPAWVDTRLVIAGDAATDLVVLEKLITLLVSKFKHVCYVAGNHELWSNARRTASKPMWDGQWMKVRK